MTMNVGRAINRYTSVPVSVQAQVLGHWDENNQWVESTLGTAKMIRATVKPVGDVGHGGIFGEELDARKEGERHSEYLAFYTKEEIQMSSIITHRGKPFKVVRRGDYNAYGYQVSVGRWGV